MDDEESDAEETQDKGDARGEIERELFDSDNVSMQQYLIELWHCQTNALLASIYRRKNVL